MRITLSISIMVTVVATAAAQIPLGSVPAGLTARIAGIGDVDGDGHGDVVVWVPMNGSVAVYSGVDGSQLASWSMPAAAGDGVIGSAGDADGDGAPDLLVSGGAAALNTPLAVVEIRDAQTGSLLTTIPQFQPACGFGYRAARIGDLDGDGLGDFAICAPTASTGGLALNGSVRLHGGDGAFIASIDGTLPSQGLGAGVAGVGDVDGDGVPDLAVASLDAGGRVQVYSGADLSVVSSYALGGNALSIASLITDDLHLTGGPDVDGDGLGDYAAGKASHSIGGVGAGAAVVVSAHDGAVIETIHGQPGDGLARDLDLDDVNGDGRGDVVYGVAATGEVVVVSGLTGNEVWSSAAGVADVAHSATVRDTDGDGQADLVVRTGPGAQSPDTLLLFAGGPWLGEAAETSVGTAAAPEEVLTAGGTTGGATRRIDRGIGEHFTIALAQPSQNPAPADFALFGMVSTPVETASHDFGSIGEMTLLPAVLAPGAPGLFTLAASAPLPGTVFLAPPGPLTLPVSGLPFAVSFTLQAIVAQGPMDLKATNALIIRVR